MQKLNILWFGSAYKKGLLYHDVLLAKKFKQRGHKIVILTSPGELVKGSYEQLKRNKIPFYTSEQTDKKTVASIFKISKMIRHIVETEDINVIQAGGFYHLIKSRLALKNTPLADKVIITTYLHSVRHGTWLEIPVRIIGSRLLNSFTNIAMPVCEQERTKMLRFGLLPQKAVTVYNAIDFDSFETNLSNPDNDKLESLGLTSPERTIAYFANLIPRKGHIYLLQAAAEVIKVFPNTHFLLVGDGTYRKELEKIIRKLEISKNVKITGWVENKYVPQILTKIYAAVVASLSETFCHAIIEPMAAGVPVITTPVGVASEIIEHKKTGMLIPFRDPSAIADSVLYLLNNREQARQIGLRGQQLVKRQFNIGTIIDKLEKLYLNELSKKNKDSQKLIKSAYRSLENQQQTISIG